jgi:cell volume regulation protein A
VTGHLDTALLVGALIVLVAVTAVRLSVRLGLPSLLVYLGIGLAVGETGPGQSFTDVDLARSLGLIALIFILAEGGLTARWRDVRPIVGLAAVLATVGVVVTIVVVALAASVVLQLDLRTALLYGAVVASTDAAAVFSTLRSIALPRHLSATLEAESIANDPIAVIAVVLLSSSSWGHESVWSVIGDVAYQMVVGTSVGLAVAVGGTYFLRRAALPASGLYPLATFAFIVGAYAACALIDASGFIAVYICALWLGNADLPHRPAVRGFAEGLAWLAQIGVFVMLGVLAEPDELPRAVLPALAVGAALLLLARPLAVLTCATPFRRPWREQVFLSWAGLRGAVPVILATVPLSAGLAGSGKLFNVVFVLVVVFTLIQSPLMAPLARRLGLVNTEELVEISVESAPLEVVHAELLELTVPRGSRLTFVEVGELRLAELGAMVSLIVREGRTFVPDPSSRLREGDRLLVVAGPDGRAATQERIAAVSRDGRAAPWRPAPGPWQGPPSGAARPAVPPRERPRMRLPRMGDWRSEREPGRRGGQGGDRGGEPGPRGERGGDRERERIRRPGPGDARDQRTRDRRRDRAEGDRAEGDRAEGDRAEGGRAEGGRAEGGRAEGGRAEGGRAGDRAEGDRAKDRRPDGGSGRRGQPPQE